ncbi:hypothetical protein Desca_1821 [Desulfotomaculum nigrificans CO-1-SRB]|uniref:Uncharacterized protein n=2 Tax=Desulfotomaculum nigrificans TaxID=1565 RepID=F6B8A3_DESCC|nr:hypothetical protein Desca_1821 [Desulfotomaculum nigrificans CO-1-SRB]
MVKSLGQLQQQVSLAVMKKAMDAAEQSGSLVQQMLDKAAEGRAVLGEQEACPAGFLFAKVPGTCFFRQKLTRTCFWIYSK